MSDPGVPAENVQLLKKFSTRAGVVHGSIPYIRKVPKRSIGIILLLILINIIVWIVAGVILVFPTPLMSILKEGSSNTFCTS
jgi:hypothetical protein